jgi:hypothetical protein
MAQNDIVILQEQEDGSLKETLLTPPLIGAQKLPIISEDAPSAEDNEDDQVWIRASDLQSFYLYNDGDSRTWVQLPPPPHSHEQSDVTNLESDMIVFSLAFGG